MIHVPLDNYRQNVYRLAVTKDEFKKFRESIGYTQARLSKEMDVTIRTITRWENGEVRIPRVVEIAIRAIVRDAKKKRRA